MKSIDFTIPGPPRGKGRPRFTTVCGHARAITPEETASYENLVKLAFREKSAEMFGSEEPIGMRINAFYPIPKSASKKRKSEMLCGIARPKVKPDADNVAKIVCDALNGIAYRDDTQVVYLELSKRYADEPRVEVDLWAL